MSEEPFALPVEGGRGEGLAHAPRIAIVGGGFSGAACAVQLVTTSASALDVTVVEPREALGRGMAYDAPDPDHRLNGNTDSHVLDPADPRQLGRWCDENGVFERDPEALARNGNAFIRRHDFGRFVGDQVRAHSRMANGSTIRHLRDVATDARLSDGGARVVLRSGATLESELLVIATGSAPPKLPHPLQALAADARVIADPFDLARVRAIDADARVLLLGSGLTALDIASTLVRRGHRGPITALSRRGLRPRLHRLAPASKGPTLLERIEGPVPHFVRDAGPHPSARGLLRALRGAIREAERSGGEWYAPFDALRDVLWKVWPTLEAREKRRAQRWLRPWYDMHRFRAPPQNDALVRQAEYHGRVSFRAARLVSVASLEHELELRILARGAQRPAVERFDVLVNCTGLDPASGARDNPLLAALLEAGHLAVDPSGIGFAVDAQCRPLGRDGRARERLRMIGPPTAGTFGDPLGVLFIAPQIRRIVPGMLATVT